MDKSPKIGVIFFHKNITQLYNERWIKKSVESMSNQTIGNFKVYEINYGGDDFTVTKYIENIKIETFFVSRNLENHAEAMNYIIDKAFSDGCDYVFNTNLDDYYSSDRIKNK